MTTPMPMPLPVFWTVVGALGWTKGANALQVQVQVLKTMTLEQVQSAQVTMVELSNQLDRAIMAYELYHRHTCGLGDDSFSDLIAHIVGLGEAEYNAALEDPSLAVERAQANNFTESFAYVWPNAQDYARRGNLAEFVTWAERNRANYMAALGSAVYAPVHADVKLVIAAMDMVLAKDTAGFLASETEVLAAVTKVTSFADRMMAELAAFNTNTWAVKNLYTDVKQAFAF